VLHLLDLALGVSHVLDGVIVAPVDLLEALLEVLLSLRGLQVGAVRGQRVDLLATRVVELLDDGALDEEVIEELESLGRPLDDLL